MQGKSHVTSMIGIDNVPDAPVRGSDQMSEDPPIASFLIFNKRYTIHIELENRVQLP